MAALVLGTSERRTSVATRPCAGGQSSPAGATGSTTFWSAIDRGRGTASAFGLDLGLGLGVAAMHAKRSTAGSFRPIAIATVNAPKAMAYPYRRPPDPSSP